MKPLIKPPALQPGDTLAMYAPANAISLDAKVVAKGYGKLEEMGFKVYETPLARQRHGHTAGTPAERAKVLHDLLTDDRIAGIMTFWGGYQSHQVLEHLDFDLIRANPKVIIGYSDVTSLTVGVFAKTGVVGFSGPAGISFVKPTLPDYTRNAFSDVLIAAKGKIVYQASTQWSDNQWWAEKPEPKMIFEPTPQWQTLKPGKVQGPLLPANLGTLLLLNGTTYWPDLTGVVLVIEEDEVEKPETIDRLFTQLRQIGAFDKIAGLAFGRLPRCVGFSAQDRLEDLILYATRGYNFPVLINLDYGHTDPILTLPIGILAELDADRQSLTLLEASVNKTG